MIVTMADAFTLAKKKPARIKRRNKWTRDDTELTLLALPTSIWFFLFCYLPMFGIIIAFKEYKVDGNGFLSSLMNSEWAGTNGLKNFEYFFKLKDFPQILRNTLLYNIVFICLDMVLPVTLAIMMSNIYSKKKSKFYQTLMFMPHFMSWVVCSYFVYAFLITDKGLLNQLIVLFGGEKVNWYFEAKHWPVILTILHIWKGIGYSMVVYLATITGIDTSLYEAAVLDGASKWQQARYITIPCLKGMIILMFNMAIGSIFNSDFGLFYQVPLGSGLLYSTTQTIDTYVYRALLELNDVGMSSAASVFQAIIGFILVVLSNALVRFVDPDNALF